MTEPRSLAMAVPLARRDVCNTLMEALGRGPNTFSVALLKDGELAAYGAHTWDDELATALETITLPPGVTLAQLQAYGFTGATARTAVGYIRYRAVPSRDAFANFLERIALDGWTIQAE